MQQIIAWIPDELKTELKAVANEYLHSLRVAKFEAPRDTEESNWRSKRIERLEQLATRNQSRKMNNMPGKAVKGQRIDLSQPVRWYRWDIN